MINYLALCENVSTILISYLLTLISSNCIDINSSYYFLLNQCYLISKEKKGKKGKAARPSLVGNSLTEIEKELKAIEEDEEKKSHKSTTNDSSSEDDSDEDATGVIGKCLTFLKNFIRLDINATYDIT